ncbi:MAG: HPr family phosphocarrier protein [Deltaproteobacteria bacterium]|nr:HPr family phosphocarrier protein [Deltaproteobacteria bacterium]
MKKSNNNAQADLTKSMTIDNQLGMHARAAARIVRLAEKAKGQVFIEKDGISADAGSVLDILTLNCPMGCTVTVRAVMAEDKDVVESIERLIKNKFGEPE